MGDTTIVTEDTLTSDPNPPRGDLAEVADVPPGFASDLLLNARLARSDAFPKDVPTLVPTGGEKEDVYVDTAGVKDWGAARKRQGARVYGLGCDGARHELDNEIAPIRDVVRASAAAFAMWTIDGAAGGPSVPTTGACKAY